MRHWKNTATQTPDIDAIYPVMDMPLSEHVITFSKTKKPYGEMQNMHSKFPFSLCKHQIASSEALYQALRFPNRPDLQQQVLTAASPFVSKQLAYNEGVFELSAPEWNRGMNITAMWVVLRLKYRAHQACFDALFDESEQKFLIERSARCEFWGAKIVDREHASHAVGRNILGRQWMEIREQYHHHKTIGDDLFDGIQTLPYIDELLLDGELLKNLI